MLKQKLLLFMAFSGIIAASTSSDSPATNSGDQTSVQPENKEIVVRLLSGDVVFRGRYTYKTTFGDLLNELPSGSLIFGSNEYGRNFPDRLVLTINDGTRALPLPDFTWVISSIEKEGSFGAHVTRDFYYKNSTEWTEVEQIFASKVIQEIDNFLNAREEVGAQVLDRVDINTFTVYKTTEKKYRKNPHPLLEKKPWFKSEDLEKYTRLMPMGDDTFALVVYEIDCAVLASLVVESHKKIKSVPLHSILGGFPNTKYIFGISIPG